MCQEAYRGECVLFPLFFTSYFVVIYPPFKALAVSPLTARRFPFPFGPHDATYNSAVF